MGVLRLRASSLSAPVRFEVSTAHQARPVVMSRPEKVPSTAVVVRMETPCAR